MGVKGLWKRVLADYAQGIVDYTETVRRGSTLLVDGNGFLFHLLNEQMYKLYDGVEPRFEREYGGNYKELGHVIRLELERLSNTLGFECIFYFDGYDSFFKGDTTNKRRESIKKTWSNWYNVVIGDQNEISEHHYKDLPIPPLAKDELLWCLRQLNIKSIVTEYEADQEMAIECHRRNLKGAQAAQTSAIKVFKRCYCYSGDSDFLAMKDCPLIAFGSLDPFTGTLSKSKVYREIDVVVWRRENVAKLYSISESEFVDLCIYVGNDFTEHFANKHGKSTPATSLNLPMPIYDSSILMSKEFEAAVQYSKAFYELEDLTEFYLLDEYRTSNQLDSWHDMDPGAILLPTQSSSIRSWVIHNSSRLIKEKAYSHQVVALFFKEIMSKSESTSAMMTPSKLKSPHKNSNNHLKPTGSGKKDHRKASSEFVEHAIAEEFEEHDSKLFDLIKPHHFDALSEMHGYLVEKRDIVIRLKDGNSNTVPMKWENVCAANLYQLMSKTLRRHFLTLFDDDDPQRTTPWQPSVFFHAKLFHYFLYKRGNTLNKRNLSSGGSNASAINTKDVPILPVDSHRETILQTVSRDRVTIIHGETGCGKSSKIPLFILEDCEKKRERCKIMIAQPRRIAVVNLRNRLRDFLGDKIGMRMGHGVREESANTKIFFVTTGYLVRLLAHSPMALQSITHLIIDEVHERSVDGDLLCWLTKRYLTSNLRLKVLLMSATLHTHLYQSYFTNAGGMFAGGSLGALEDDDGDVEESDGIPKCLSVGVRRFPAQINYVEDLLRDTSFSNRTRNMCQVLMKECERLPDVKEVPASLVKSQYDLVLELIRIKANIGTGVLVFVSGLADIIELQSRFENLQSNRYRCVAIHSEIPFEEQECALQPAEPTEVKVIIATNAAESSITLPDVDLVICLGTHKAVNYRQGDLMRSTLLNTWISKSSAVQRAGRTGRVRPGEVYRLYTNSIYEKFHEHQQAEIHRKPLHEIILTLKAIFQDSEDFYTNGNCVSTVLNELLEPPDLSQLQHCFDFLFESGMISTPTDDSKLTSHGSFTGRMPVDLSLCKLIIYGVSIGLGAEAVILASALSQPKTLFRIASPLVHTNPDEYNEIVRKTFVGMMTFDNNCYSEPIMLLQLFITWQQLSASDRVELLQYYGIVSTRMKHFVSASHHLLKEVNKNKGKNTDDLTFDDHSLDNNLTSDTINKLRLVLLWALEFNLLQSAPVAPNQKGTSNGTLNSISIPKASVPLEVISSYFPSPRFKHECNEQGKYIYQLPAMSSSSFSMQMVPMILKNLFTITAKSHGVEQSMIVFRYDPREFESGGRGGRYGGRPMTVTRVFIAVNKRIVAEADGSDMQKSVIGRNNGDVGQPAVNLLTLSSQAAHATGGLEYLEVSNDPFNDVAIFTFIIDREDYLVVLNNYMLQIDIGFAISHQSNKEIKFVAVNFQPTSAMFRALYPTGALELDYLLADKLTQGMKKPVKVFDVTQVLTFKEEESIDEENGEDFNKSGISLNGSGRLGESFEESLGDSLREMRESPKKAEIQSESKKSGKKEDEQDGEKEKKGEVDGLVEQLVRLPMFLPLFQDLLPGKRLFNAYCLGHKDKKMKIFVKAPPKAQTTPRKITSLVPGTIAWQQKKQQSAKKPQVVSRSDEEEEEGGGRDDNEKNNETTDSDRIEVLGAKPMVTGWHIHGSFLSQNTFDAATFDEDAFDMMDVMYDASTTDWMTAVLSTRSVLSTSFYLPTSSSSTNSRKGSASTLFGVSYYALTLGAKRKMVACEGVTLFPPDKTWILRGLLCIGRRLHADAETELDILSKSQSAKTSMSAKCRNVRALVTQLKNKSFQPDKSLIEALNDLFGDYVYF